MRILDAVYEFITAYTDLDPARVFRGYQNAIALPQEADFCVYDLTDTERVGTNVETNTDTERRLYKLISYAVDVDFIGDDQALQQERASRLEALAMSSACRELFDDFNATMLYPGAVQYLPYVDENEQWLHRYRLPLHISAWELTQVDEGSAKAVKPRLVNVDTFKD